MNRIFLIGGITLILIWLLGFFVFHVNSPLFHLIIIIGIISIGVDILSRRPDWK